MVVLALLAFRSLYPKPRLQFANAAGMVRILFSASPQQGFYIKRRYSLNNILACFVGGISTTKQNVLSKLLGEPGDLEARP